MTDASTGIELLGGCACGELRYALTRKPMFTNCCHCTQCQKLTGSAFVINAIIENDCIRKLSGEVVVTSGPSEHDRPHDIYRCSKCFTAVWSDYGRRPNFRFVRVGTLDEPSQFSPDAHIFVRSKLDWVIIPDEQRSFESYYTIDKEWSPEALARRELALKVS